MKNDNLIINTIIYSHCLRDNIEMMSERGMSRQRFKNASKSFHRELDKFLEHTYSGLDEGGLDLLNQDIDATNSIFDKVMGMTLEEKIKLSNSI